MVLKNKTTLAAMIVAMGMTAAAPVMAQEADLDGDGVPNTAEPLIHTDPLNADTDGDGMNDLADSNPVFADNTLVTDGAAAPFTFGETLVENNFDYALNKDAPDHLEIQVMNPTATDLTGFSIYYTVKDLDAGTTEAYLKTLNGFTVPAGGDMRIHLDSGEEAGHFRDNPNGSYATSQAAKLMTVTLKADGYHFECFRYFAHFEVGHAYIEIPYKSSIF